MLFITSIKATTNSTDRPKRKSFREILFMVREGRLTEGELKLTLSELPKREHLPVEDVEGKPPPGSKTLLEPDNPPVA